MGKDFFAPSSGSRRATPLVSADAHGGGQERGAAMFEFAGVRRLFLLIASCTQVVLAPRSSAAEIIDILTKEKKP